MNTDRGFLTRLGEAFDEYRAERRSRPTQGARSESARVSRFLRWLTPNGGTLLLAAALIATAQVWAKPLVQPASAPSLSATTVNYQGRLANPDGTPVEDRSYGMSFALYDAQEDGNLVWGPDVHEAVPVSGGLFSVGLGSGTAGEIPPTTWNGDRYLEITVSGETLEPRELLRSVPIAGMALTVPDGSISSSKLNIDSSVDVRGRSLNNVNAIEKDGNRIHPAAGTQPAIRLISKNSVHVFINSDNDQTDRLFTIHANADAWVDPHRLLLRVNDDGDLWVRGSVTHGALIESNLQTAEEVAADRIERFSEGDVLCWTVDRLELCDQMGDTSVQAVADKNGKPIVLGAEFVNVLGPVQSNDLLVASNTPGYAIVDNNPRPGAVIAQALEPFGGDRGTIRAMIRKY